jgi:hypothetical protein
MPRSIAPIRAAAIFAAVAANIRHSTAGLSAGHGAAP